MQRGDHVTRGGVTHQGAWGIPRERPQRWAWRAIHRCLGVSTGT